MSQHNGAPGLRDFMQLSAAECGQVYPALFDNGERHFQIALMLQSHEEYGNAIAHQVLGAEEIAKGFLLLLESKGFGLRKIEGVKKIFTSHGVRHGLIKEFLSVWIAVQPVMEMMGDHLQKTGINSGKMSKNIFLDSLHTGVKFFFGTIQSTTTYDWWDGADVLKQKGFYVDYRDELVSPASNSRKDYKVAAGKVKSLCVELGKFRMQLENMSPRKLQEFLELFREAEFPDLIAESIERANPSKKKNRNGNQT